MSILRKFLQGLKDWVESFAHKPYALWALFVVSFVEASVFPLPPDVLMIALGVSAPKKSLRYGAVTALGSFAGGYLGYYIGSTLFEVVGRPILGWFGMMAKFGVALQYYHDNGISSLIISGFLPLPYIAFTMAAGFNHTLSLTTLTIGALIGRFVRFLLMGALLYYFGPPVKFYIDKYYEKISVALAAAIVLGIVLLKLL